MGSGRGARLVRVGAVAVLVVAAAVVAVRALLPGEAITAGLEEFVAVRMGGRLETGRTGALLLGGPGVVLEQGRLRGTGAELARRTGHGGDVGVYDVAYERCEVRLDLGALLAGRVEARAVRLLAPEVTLEVGGDRFVLRGVDLRLDDLALPPGAAGGPTGRVRLEVAELDHDSCPWRDVTLSGTWRARRSDDIALAAALGAGTLRAGLSCDLDRGRGGRLDGDLTLVAVPAQPLLAPYLPDLSDRLETALTGTVSGGLELADRATRLATLDLAGDLNGASGTLDASDWLRSVTPYLGPRRDLVRVRFERLEHEFVIRDGVDQIRRFELEGPDTDWQAVGTISFAGDLDLAVGVRLPAGFTPDLGAMSFLAETLRDDEGRVGLALKVGGTTRAARVGIDFARLR